MTSFHRSNLRKGYILQLKQDIKDPFFVVTNVATNSTEVAPITFSSTRIVTQQCVKLDLTHLEYRIVGNKYDTNSYSKIRFEVQHIDFFVSIGCFSINC